MTDQLTPRERAGAILSGWKMRMLEEAGITVVDKARLDALERLYGACKAADEFYGMPVVHEEYWHRRRREIDSTLEMTMSDLEAMTDGQATDATDAANKA